MKTESQRVAYVRVDRFLKQVLHRNLFKIPCLVLWDEVFFVSCNMLARMSKLQVYPDVQVIACGDPRQLQCPQNQWKGIPVRNVLEGSQLLASMCPTHVHLQGSKRFDPVLEEFCARIARQQESLQDLVAFGRKTFRLVRA